MPASRLLRAATLALFTGACGCYVYSPVDIDASTRPLPNLSAIRVTGATEGESCQRFILGIPLNGEPPLHAAYTGAITKADADALINVTADEIDFVALIYSDRCVTVRGDGIVYKR